MATGPGDFIASIRPQTLRRIDSIFAGNTNQKAEYHYPGTTFKTLLENQSVGTDEILEGGVCQAVKAWFIEGGASALAYSGTTADPAATCALAACNERQTTSVTYDKNLFVDGCWTESTPKCDNVAQMAELAAHGFLRARKDALKAMNERSISLLTNNVQANQSTGFDATIIGTSALGGNRLKMSPTNFKNLDNIAELDILRHENYLFDQALYINEGNNFMTASNLAFFSRNSPEAGSSFALLEGLVGDRMRWDREGGTFLARNTTFIVNPDVVLYFNTTYTEGFDPVLTNVKENIWTYKMEDPEIMYRRNGVLVPLVWEVEYTYDCTGRNALGQMIFAHTWKVKHIGGLHLAPAGLAPLATASTSRPIRGVVEVVAEV